MEWMLFAESASQPESVPFWTSLGGSVLGASFTVWYAWYTASKVIPSIIREHRIEQARLTSEFQIDVRTQRTDFLSALSAQTSYHERMMDRMENRITECVHDELRKKV